MPSKRKPSKSLTNRMQWLLDQSTESLHQMWFHIRKESFGKDLTDGQVWFWDRISAELQRRNDALPFDLKCWCEHCTEQPELWEECPF